MKIVTSGNTNNEEISSDIAKPPKFEDFISAMESKGYNMFDAWKQEDKCVKIGNSTYPTFISSDGKVKMGWTQNTLFLHRDDVWMGDSTSRPSTIILAGIVTEQDARGQGLASQALQDFKNSAIESGFEVELEPIAVKKFIQKKQPALTDKQLAAWYKRHGFDRKYPNTDSILSTKKQEPFI